MADGFVAVAPDSTGKKIDASEVVVGPNTVDRQRIVIANNVADGNYLTITAAGAVKVDGSATTQPIAGTVAIAALPGSPAQDGTDATGVAQVAGGVGIRGWLSSIYNRLSGTLATSVSNFPATQAVSGTIAVSTLPALPAGAAAIGTVGVTALPALPTGANVIGSIGNTAFGVTGPVNAASGTTRTVLTPTSPTAVTSISATARRLVKIQNASTTAQSVTISLFDESGALGAAATLMYSAILGPSQVISLDTPLVAGLSYSLSGAPLANIIVVSS